MMKTAFLFATVAFFGGSSYAATVASCYSSSSTTACDDYLLRGGGSDENYDTGLMPTSSPVIVAEDNDSDENNQVRMILDRLDQEMEGRVVYPKKDGSRRRQWWWSWSSKSRSDDHDVDDECWRLDLPEPWAIVRVQSEADVVKAVPILATLQKDYGIPFCIRSGGHHYIGYSKSCAVAGGTEKDVGICLSLSRLNSIQVDIPTTRKSDAIATATFGPGTRGLDILEQVLQPHGYGAVLGACPTVAEGGFLLGGGFSYLSRRYGLGCDNLEEITAVLASGEIVTCSSSNENADLFWALRGAGSAGFAVATKYKYRLFPSQDEQLYGSGMLSMDEATSFIHQVGSKNVNKVPLNAGAVLFLFAKKHFGDKWLGSLSWYDQSEAGLVRGRDVLTKALSDCGIRDKFKFERESWTAHTKRSGMGQGQFRVWNGFLNQNSKKAWKGLLNDLKTIRDEGEYICIEILLWGGKIAEVGPHDTAFPWRHGLYNIAVNLSVPTSIENAKEVFEEKTAIIEKLWAKLRKKYGLKGVYYNYPMETLKPKDFGRQYWGSHNLKRLQKIKQKYDPENVFRHPQSILPY